MPRKYNMVSKAPAALEELISLINALPSDLKKLEDDYSKLYNGRTVVNGRTHILDKIYEKQGSIEIFRGQGTVSLPEVMSETLIKYIFDREPETDSAERFKYLLKANSLFHKFAELSKTYMALSKEKRDALKDDDEQKYQFFLHFLTIKSKDREFSGLFGFHFPEMYIKPQTNDFVRLFEDFDIPFFRIRACPVCENIYWASKLNSETCGKKECVTILANRKRKK